MRNDVALDALVGAPLAYPLHHAPDRLYKLRHDVSGKTGRGSEHSARHTQRRRVLEVASPANSGDAGEAPAVGGEVSRAVPGGSRPAPAKV